MTLRLQPVPVATSSETEGQLVFDDGMLVAVLTRLSHNYDDEAGRWFLEAGFGKLYDVRPPTFADLSEARDWITCRLGGEMHP